MTLRVPVAKVVSVLVREGRRVQACDVAAAQGEEGGFYWRDIGLVDAYWEASMDLLG